MTMAPGMAGIWRPSRRWLFSAPANDPSRNSSGTASPESGQAGIARETDDIRQALTAVKAPKKSAVNEREERGSWS
jgi:hypothetical protein